MSANQNLGFSNVYTYVGEKYSIYKSVIRSGLKGHIYAIKGSAFNVAVLYVEDFIQMYVHKIGIYSLFTRNVHTLQGNVREPGSCVSRLFSCLQTTM